MTPKQEQELQKTIARKLVDIVEESTRSVKHQNEAWEKHGKDIIRDLEQEIELTLELIQDFKESQLTINAVEQEGYLRCLQTLKERYKFWQELLET